MRTYYTLEWLPQLSTLHTYRVLPRFDGPTTDRLGPTLCDLHTCPHLRSTPQLRLPQCGALCKSVPSFTKICQNCGTDNVQPSVKIIVCFLLTFVLRQTAQFNRVCMGRSGNLQFFLVFSADKLHS